MALCWIVEARGFYYVSNTASNTVSSFRIDAAGKPTLLNAVAAATPAGPIDMAVPGGGDFLYAQTGTAGTVEEFRVEANGSLTRLGSVTGLPVGMEGIAAT
jgi:6-phosphogluconolactonase (cycloisomerase 2 family)